jgi:tetratricopeptide (TPR) repeat protein
MLRVRQAAADAICTRALRWVPKRADALSLIAVLCTTLGRPRRAYEALDRLLEVEPENPGAWRQLQVVLQQADPELAYWIGLKSLSRRHVDLMLAALKVLVAMKAEPDRVLELLPDFAWREPALDESLPRLESKLGPAELVAIGSMAKNAGRARDAEDLLAMAIRAEPDAMEVRLALSSLLEESYRFTEAETILHEVIRRRPDDSEARLNLARIQCQCSHFEQALETLETLLAAAPNNGRAWFELGQIARNSYDRPADTADMAFQRAGDLASDDPIMLERVAQYFREERKYEKALTYYDRLFATSASAVGNPVSCRNYAECLRACGRLDEARAMTEAGIKRCEEIASNCAGEGWERIKVEEARTMQEAGQSAEAVEVLRTIRATSDPARAAFDRPEYLPATPNRLRRLKSIVGSRDLIVLLQGPSFADLATRLEELAKVDFAIAVLGSFPPVERELSQRLGRGADVLFITHPAMLRTWFPELQQYLARSSSNLLITTRYALSSLPELGTTAADFMAQHDSRLLFVNPDGGPPLPSRPLHFEHGNSLAVLLPLLLLGQPKRVFISGADGGANPIFGKRPYFYYQDIDSDGPEASYAQGPEMLLFKGQPERLREANRRFARDAIQADNVILWALQDLQTVFEMPVPPIYNLCPHSTHVAFPRIDCDTGIAMLREGR